MREKELKPSTTVVTFIILGVMAGIVVAAALVLTL
jgi:hypothetical protein